MPVAVKMVNRKCAMDLQIQFIREEKPHLGARQAEKAAREALEAEFDMILKAAQVEVEMLKKLNPAEPEDPTDPGFRPSQYVVRFITDMVIAKNPPPRARR